MRFLLTPLLLLAALSPLAQAKPTLIMYVGDSLTHGYSSASYRWHLHKMLVDSGFEYEELGVLSGNTGKNALKAGSHYRGVSFQNIHSAQSSARSWEISGLRAGPRFGGTKLENWLGLAPKTAAGKDYKGKIFAEENAPEIFVMMIGTNDLLSDNERAKGGLPAIAARETKELLHEVKRIYQSMLQANPKAHIYLCTVPSWGSHRSLDKDDWRQVIFDYNRALKRWAKGKKQLHIVDVNQGLIPQGLKAEPLYFIADGLHFNEQGNLLVAGNIARAMKLKGRHAGLKRKSPQALSATAPKAAQSITLSLPASGQGIYHVSNGQHEGQLELSAQQISWQAAKQKTPLYSGDRRKSKEEIRLTWVKGNPAQGIGQGYYIWLGNQLIGEALPAQENKNRPQGVESNKNASPKVIDMSGNYAPNN